MNKKLLTILSIILIAALAIAGYMVFGDNNKTTAEPKPNVVEPKENTKKEEKSEYAKDLEEVIGDNKIDTKEMIKIGDDLTTKYFKYYEADNEEQFTAYVAEALIDPTKTVEGLKNCCYVPNTYEDVKVEFSGSSVIQVDEKTFEYRTIAKISSTNIQINETQSITYVVAGVITKDDKGVFQFTGVSQNPTN